MKKKLLISIIIVLIIVLILLGFFSYFIFLNKNSSNENTSRTQKFTEVRCDDLYCVSDLSIKYINKKRAYYSLKGLAYYKSEEVIDKYCIKITLVSKDESEVLKKCFDAGFSNFFINFDEAIVSKKYKTFDDVKIERMSEEEIKEYYMYE